METIRLEAIPQDKEGWKKLWETAVVRDVTPTDKRITQLVDKLSCEYSNGEIIFRQYEIELDEGVASGNQSLAFNMWDNMFDLMGDPTVAQSVPDVSNPSSPREALGLEVMGCYHFIADLAGLLHMGGAYSRSSLVNGDEALMRSKDFFEALFGPCGYQYQPLVICRASNQWSSWFYDVCWDFCWFFHDIRRQRVTMFLGTDTD